VRWQYPKDEAAKPLKAKEPGLLPDPQEPRHYHVGYELGSSKPPPAWQPRQVVDDGKKTFIIYPEVTLFETVSMRRPIGPNGPQLVNARQFFNVVILDQLVARGELRVGLGEHAETVTITRGGAAHHCLPRGPGLPGVAAGGPDVGAEGAGTGRATMTREAWKLGSCTSIVRVIQEPAKRV
jgi:Conjugal transfer protein